MNYLWKISQDSNTNYDTYDSAIVCAPDAQAARGIHPDGNQDRWSCPWGTWCDTPDQVAVELIGVACDVGDSAIPPGVVLASFNAG